MNNVSFPNLDARLTQAFGLVPNCTVCADVGADHGLLSLALLVSGRAKQMIISDISEKALNKAKKKITFSGFAKSASFYVCDGLNSLQYKSADAICILGMGGQTILHILQNGVSLLKGATLILGAQTEISNVRAYLYQIGYELEQEVVVNMGKHDYFLMRCIPTKKEKIMPYSKKECLLGPLLLQNPTPSFLEWLAKRKQRLQFMITAMSNAKNDKDDFRLFEAKEELGYIEEELKESVK